jgi:hypothetical protein
MEPAGFAFGVNSFGDMGILFHGVCGDDDCKMTAAAKDPLQVPRAEYSAIQEKWSDPNHRKKNFSGHLIELKDSAEFKAMGKRPWTNEQAIHLSCRFSTVVKTTIARVQMPGCPTPPNALTKEEATKVARNGVLTMLHHEFNRHELCEEYSVRALGVRILLAITSISTTYVSYPQYLPGVHVVM